MLRQAYIGKWISSIHLPTLSPILPQQSKDGVCSL